VRHSRTLGRADERFGTIGSDIIIVLAGKRDVGGSASPIVTLNEMLDEQIFNIGK
jgi:hypothetical protein